MSQIAINAIISTLAGSGITYFLVKFNKHTREHSLIRANLKIARKRELTKDYKFHKRRGYISEHELDVWMEGYDQYKELDGNSFIDCLKEEIEKIKIKD